MQVCANGDLSFLSAAAAAGTTSGASARKLTSQGRDFLQIQDTSTTSNFLFTQAHSPILYLPSFYTNPLLNL